MTRTKAIPPLTRLAVCGSSSSSGLAQRTIQPHYFVRNTSIIPQTHYHPARRRAFTTTTTCQKQKQASVDATGPRKPRVFITKDAVEREFTIDEDIPTREVQVKDAETNKLKPPQSLISVLSSIDRDVQVVRALATPPDAPTIVEITARANLTDRLKNKEIAALENARATRARKPKQIEINWALSSNDLQMKLKQLREFLDKGKKVDILLASRKRQRKATLDEAQNVVDEIRKTIGDIEGCREISPMEGKIGGQALMVVQKQA